MFISPKKVKKKKQQQQNCGWGIKVTSQGCGQDIEECWRPDVGVHHTVS